MNRNNCEACLQLHRTFLPRRRTGRGFLTGTIFLDTALLIAAFVLATSPFVKKPGVMMTLPIAESTEGLRPNGMVLSVGANGRWFFNDQPVQPDTLVSALRSAAQRNPGKALILEADQHTDLSTAAVIYDAAAAAGFRQVLIATRPTP